MDSRKYYTIIYTARESALLISYQLSESLYILFSREFSLIHFSATLCLMYHHWQWIVLFFTTTVRYCISKMRVEPDLQDNGRTRFWCEYL